MTDQIKAIIKEVERFNDSIRETLTAKGINDTGEAARSLYVDYATSATSTNAFLNQTALTNYASIPNGWKGL